MQHKELLLQEYKQLQQALEKAEEMERIRRKQKRKYMEEDERPAEMPIINQV